MTSIIVIKNDHAGRELWRYEARVLARSEHCIQLEAHFNRDTLVTAYHTFRRGDRFVEWYYSDRWYNIFEMHDVDDDHLTGWYCNVTRPAVFGENTICADDLALDVIVQPDGRWTVLDEDEFAALPLDAATRAQASRALEELLRRVETRQPPFDTA